MSELVFLVLAGGGLFAGNDFLGMPPQARQADLIQAAPANAVVYMEWAERSEGQPGAEGVDGLIADVEIRAFLEKLTATTRETLLREMQNEPPRDQIAARSLPELGLLLLNRPGCAFMNFDPAAVKVDPSFGPPTPSMLAAGFSGAVIFHGGPEADQIAAELESLLRIIQGDAAQGSLTRLVLPTGPELPPVTIHREKDFFILAIGESTLDDILAGLGGERPGMDKNERFQKAFESVQFERTASVGWFDLSGAIDRAATVMGPMGEFVKGMSTQIGLASIDSVVSVAGVDDGKISNHTFLITDGKLNGIMATMAGRPIVKEDFALIPADADMVAAFSISFPRIFSEIERIVAGTDPGLKQQMDAVVQAVETAIGLSLRDDIFAAMDDVWTVYDSPSAGGVLITSAVVSLQVKDAEAAYRTMAQLMTILKGVMPPLNDSRPERRSYMAESQFLDRTIYFINTVGEDLPFAPAFCVTNKQFLFALQPQALKAHLRMLDESVPVHEGVTQEDGDLLGYFTMDSESAVRYLYSVSPYIAQVIFGEAQKEGFGMDVFSYPSARAILPYMKDSDSRLIRKEDGIHLLDGRSLSIPGISFFSSNTVTFSTFLFIELSRGFAELGGAEFENAVPVKQERKIQLVR